jgi:hypothetical protein
MTESGILGLFTMASTENREPKQLRFSFAFLPACAVHPDRHEISQLMV